MRKRLFGYVAIMSLLLVAGMLVIAQSSQQTFTEIQRFGYARPNGIEYDPNFDRFVWVENGLQIVNARTLETEFTIASSISFNDYVFSHDGRYLAIAIDKRVELWDLQNQTKVAEFSPDGSLSVVGPLFFGDDDRLLQLNSVVPAPQETRRSENDTNIIPYTWDLVAAREEALTILPNRSDTYAFFNYRNGLALGQNNTVIAGVPSRILVIDALNPGEIANEIPAPQRFEQDPITVWKSATDQYLYVQPNGQNNLVQVNTEDKSIFDIALGATLDRNLATQMQSLALSNITRRLGEQGQTSDSSLLRLLLGENYRSEYGYKTVTVTLIDWLMPMTMGDEQMGLLVYIYSEDRQSGSVDLVRPNDILQMRLSPDRMRIMVRRASAAQPIEIYNLDTGILERSYTPKEVDFEARHILALNATGSEIITDFQRFDVQTGDTIFYDERYTTIPFDFTFGSDNRTFITFDNFDEWRVWDIATGKIVDVWQPFLTGDVIDKTDDNRHFLLQEYRDNDLVFVRYDAINQARTQTTITNGASLGQVVPSPNWRYFATTNGNTVRVFDENGTQILYITDTDLPAGYADSVSWYDNENLVIRSSSQEQPPGRLYGVDYHPSGLPQCLIEAYPNNWEQFINLWEQFHYNFSSDSLNLLTVRLCTNLTDKPEDLTLQLTPTPATPYFAERTPRPFVVAGVPTCLTRQFVNEALAYAEIWRNMSAGLDDTAKKELEEQLCEGLISSLSGVQPTATIDPNTLSGPTPTPLPDSPDTVNNANNFAPNVMLLNIFTGERTQGNYVPQSPNTDYVSVRNFDLILRDYRQQFNNSPANSQISPDGRLLAVQSDATGFITIYQLGKPYLQLAQEATETVQVAVTGIRSVGIAPTATEPFVYVGQPNPTLTPTITLTAIPLVESTASLVNLDTVEAICPFKQLFDMQTLPEDYAAQGRLLTLDYEKPGIWVLDPQTGIARLDESLPPCYDGNCTESFDGNWVIRNDNGLGYSRYDGTDETIIYDTFGTSYVAEFSWEGLHTLINGYNSYYPDPEDDARIIPTTLYQSIDVETNEATELLPRVRENMGVNNLPTQILAEQPIIKQFLLVSTPFIGGGEKYYIYDRQTKIATYFLRTDTNPVENYFWHPLGTVLYYRTDNVWYIFDASTQEHRILGNFYDGKWSRDGRYTIDWFTQSSEAYIERVAENNLPLKIQLWDSETGLVREYCLPETGLETYSNRFLWSPDNRYVVFQIYLPVSGDFFPTLLPFDAPTPTATPSPTPVNLELEYELLNPRVLVLDTVTGSVTILTDETQMPYAWLDGQGDE